MVTILGLEGGWGGGQNSGFRAVMHNLMLEVGWWAEHGRRAVVCIISNWNAGGAYNLGLEDGVVRITSG